MKKYLSMLLVAAMCLAMLAGCGATETEASQSAAESDAVTAAESAVQEEPAAEESADQTEAPAAAESAEEPKEAEAEADSISYPLDGNVTISWWRTADPTVAMYIDVGDYDGLPVVAAAEEATGVHIDNMIISQEAETETFNLMVASGDMADMIDGFISKYSGGGTKALEDGLILDLADYEEYMPDYMQVVHSNEEIERDVYADDGTMPSFYIIRETPTNRPQSGLVYRKDWLDALGMDVPTTYDEFEEMLYAFQSEYGTTKTLYLTRNGAFENNVLAAGLNAVVFLNANGNNTVEPFYQVDGEIKFGLMEQGFVDYIKMMNKWYNDGLISSDFTTADGNPNDSAFLSAATSGETGVWVGPAMTISSLEQSAEDASFALTGGRDISENADDVFHIGYDISYIDTPNVSITTCCENPEVAIEWENYFCTEEGILLKNWGIEGESYTVENGEPVYTDLITDNPDGYPVSVALAMYTIDSAGVYMDNESVTYTQEAIDAMDVWATDKVCDYNLPPYMTMTVSEAETYSSTWSDIGTYCSESILKFIIGEMDIDTDFEDFCNNLTAMGIDKCIEAQQSALDRYYAR